MLELFRFFFVLDGHLYQVSMMSTDNEDFCNIIVVSEHFKVYGFKSYFDMSKDFFKNIVKVKIMLM